MASEAAMLGACSQKKFGEIFARLIVESSFSASFQGPRSHGHVVVRQALHIWVRQPK